MKCPAALQLATTVTFSARSRCVTCRTLQSYSSSGSCWLYQLTNCWMLQYWQHNFDRWTRPIVYQKNCKGLRYISLRLQSSLYSLGCCVLVWYYASQLKGKVCSYFRPVSSWAGQNDSFVYRNRFAGGPLMPSVSSLPYKASVFKIVLNQRLITTNEVTANTATMQCS